MTVCGTTCILKTHLFFDKTHKQVEMRGNCNRFQMLEVYIYINKKKRSLKQTARVLKGARGPAETVSYSRVNQQNSESSGEALESEAHV